MEAAPSGSMSAAALNSAELGRCPRMRGRTPIYTRSFVRSVSPLEGILPSEPEHHSGYALPSMERAREEFVCGLDLRALKHATAGSEFPNHTQTESDGQELNLQRPRLIGAPNA